MYLFVPGKTGNDILKKAIRDAKLKYYEQQISQHKNNIKKTWGVISELLSKKNNRQYIGKLTVNGRQITDQKTIVEQFNNFFINIGPSLSNKIEIPRNLSYQKYLTGQILTSFNFKLVETDEITKIINNFPNKSSAGYDGISLKVLKWISPAIVKPLTIIINQSLLTGIFPDALKIAKVLPLYKKQETDIMDNYRPISLLASFSKVFEKVAFKQLYTYFKNNNLFFYSQYGFLPDHSFTAI